MSVKISELNRDINLGIFTYYLVKHSREVTRLIESLD